MILGLEHSKFSLQQNMRDCLEPVISCVGYKFYNSFNHSFGSCVLLVWNVTVMSWWLNKMQVLPMCPVFNWLERSDLVWSDPEEVDTWAVSPRGAGWLFGAKVTNEVHCLYLHRKVTIFGHLFLFWKQFSSCLAKWSSAFVCSLFTSTISNWSAAHISWFRKVRFFMLCI